MGGCAPYSSTAGMFTSSTTTTTFLPTGAPSSVLRFFSSLPSMVPCVTALEVRALKFRNTGKMVSAASLSPSASAAAATAAAAAAAGSSSPSTSSELVSRSASCRMTVLPVPVTPVKNTGASMARSHDSILLYRTVSAVGTSISKYGSVAS